MVCIITLNNPRLAQAFIDYMATQDIHLTTHSDGHSIEIWLEDEQHQARVEHELHIFLQDPLNARYQAASWTSGNTTSGITYQRFSFLHALRSQAGPVTLSVMVLCILVYLLMTLFGNQAVMYWLAWPVSSAEYGQVWRWITPALLHFSLLHILFNVMWWWYLGGMVERNLGSGKLFVITLVSAFFSGWAESLYSGANFGGLSGVVYALMGYTWLCGERAPERGLFLQRGLMVFSILWLAVGYFGWFGMSIANAAHIGGLVIGLLMALWDTQRRAQ